MKLEALWRYPVKSMGGERLDRAELRRDGIAGDRVVHVEDGRGRVVTSRSRPGLLLHHATLGPDLEPLVDGRPWRSAEVRDDVRRAVRGEAELALDESTDRFDVLPLLVATDGALAAFGHDVRRLRPNIVIGGVEGLTERAWEGRTIRIGRAVIRAVSLRQRCIMTTFDPDTAEQNVEVLKKIHHDFGGRFALDCEVLEPAEIRIGDPVLLLDRPRRFHL
jgi:uncharacterized protein